MRYAQDAVRHDATGINVIPLADVLLVLLIIFMVTAPTASVRLAMALSQPGPTPPTPPEPWVLRVDAAGDVYSNGTLLPLAELRARLRQAGAAAADAQPVLRIDASDQADYDAVAQVLAAAQDAGLRRVGFAR